MAEAPNITNSFFNMFNAYGGQIPVSGTSVPTFFLAVDKIGKDENGKDVVSYRKPSVVKTREVIVKDKNGKETKKIENASYDIEANNIYAPLSLFSDFKLFHYSGITGFMYPNDPNFSEKYFDDKKSRTGIMWANMEPNYQNIIEAYSGIEAGSYKIQDFIYNKYFNKIPPNYLITLRRYSNACDDIPFTLGWDEYVHSNLYPESVQLPIATATTYISEIAGNKMEDVLKFSFGTNWAEKESEIQSISSQTPGATGFGIGQNLFSNGAGSQHSMGDFSGHFNAGLNAMGTNLFTGMNLTYAQQTVAEAYAGIDPWEKFSKYTQGPVDVVKKTKARDQGLEFTHDFNLKFEYELKSLKFVNPKIAMLDIISNMIMMGTNTGTWWGGATRYFGTGGGYGKQIGDLSLFAKGDYAGYFKSVANRVTDNIGKLTGKDFDFSLESVIGLAKDVLKGGLANMLGSLINGNLGKMGATPPAHALLSGAPTGYWHVTVGNPLNPIAMMGNMICNNIEVVMGEGLGYDDFPVNVAFNCTLSHGKPRDAGDIESMFNAGKGRIYMSPYLGNGETPDGVDGSTAEKMKELYKQIGNRRDVNHIGENVGKNKSVAGGYNKGNTKSSLLNKTIDQVVAYTR